MFVFTAPWILVFLPLPVLIWLFLPATRRSSEGVLKAPFLIYMKEMLDTQTVSVKRHIRPYCLAAFIWLLLVCAAAGPQWLGSPLSFPRHGRNIMLAVDISGSMQIPDMSIHGQSLSRLEAVQWIGKQFIEKRVGDRLGLILFGTKAYLQTPLTFDRNTVLYGLEDSSIGLAGELSAVGDAIALAVKHLKDFPDYNRVLILLTDGASNSGQFTPLEAANLAAHYRIKIYTIGFGSDNLMVPSVFGVRAVNPSADLDEPTLKFIASTTGGDYFRAKDTDSLNQIYDQINQLEPIAQGKIEYRPQKALYPWPLGLAFLIAFLLLLKRTLPLIKNHVGGSQ